MVEVKQPVFGPAILGPARQRLAAAVDIGPAAIPEDGLVQAELRVAEGDVLQPFRALGGLDPAEPRAEGFGRQ